MNAPLPLLSLPARGVLISIAANIIGASDVPEAEKRALCRKLLPGEAGPCFRLTESQEAALNRASLLPQFRPLFEQA